jgi:hypothetical protein
VTSSSAAGVDYGFEKGKDAEDGRRVAQAVSGHTGAQFVSHAQGTRKRRAGLGTVAAAPAGSRWADGHGHVGCQRGGVSLRRRRRRRPRGARRMLPNPIGTAIDTRSARDATRRHPDNVQD